MPRVGEYIWDGKYDDAGRRRVVDCRDIDVEAIELEDVGAGSARSMLMRGDAAVACAKIARDGVEVQCCYIDPPFDVGHAFAMTGRGPEAYGDSWGTGDRSYIQMMYERCAMIRQVLSDDGCLLVHCDWRVSHRLRMMLDELFGEDQFRNEIIWSYRSGGASRKKSLPRKHDSILLYSKSEKFSIRPLVERQYLRKAFMGSKVDECGRHYVDTLLRDVIEGAPTVLDDSGVPREVNCRPVLNVSSDRLGYPTQKPLGLLELLIRATTDPGDVVADFFCGSGTTLEAAMRTGRTFVGADVGGQGFRTSRGRLIRAGASFKVIDAGVFRREGDFRNSDEYLLAKFGASQDAMSVWRRDGMRCERGANGVRRVIAGGEAEAVVLFDRFAEDDELAVSEAKRSGVSIDARLIPREVYDPCERKELNWQGPVRVRFDCRASDGRIMVTLRAVTIGSRFATIDDFIDSWGVDPTWGGSGPMRPIWRSARGLKGERIDTVASLKCDPGRDFVGVVVVDAHGCVHRMAIALEAVAERSVPIIPA